MDVILKNPYRILGLPANITEKELQKQLSLIRRFAEVERIKSFDYDFPFLGLLERNPEEIKSAASKIEQSVNRIIHGLYWFINNNRIDETAIEYLKQANIEKAKDIWEKLVNSGSVSELNFSAYSNIATIILGMTVLNDIPDLSNIKKAIELKILMIKSESFKDFVFAVSGNGFLKEQSYYIERFINEILEYLDKFVNLSNTIFFISCGKSEKTCTICSIVNF